MKAAGRAPARTPRCATASPPCKPEQTTDRRLPALPGKLHARIPLRQSRPVRLSALAGDRRAVRRGGARRQSRGWRHRCGALELKLERLKAAEDVENLENTYGFYADKSMQDAISALFAENATLEILGRGVFIGRDRVYEYMRRLGEPTYGTLFNHMQLQPVVHVAPDANSAKIRAHLFVMFGGYSQAAQWGEGVYENTFVSENGVWKYQNLNGFQTFYTNYEEGWAKKPSAGCSRRSRATRRTCRSPWPTTPTRPCSCRRSITPTP